MKLRVGLSGCWRGGNNINTVFMYKILKKMKNIKREEGGKGTNTTPKTFKGNGENKGTGAVQGN